MTILDGRYRLGDRIASGGMADVYRATDERLGRQVAIKLFRAGTAVPDARDRLASEVRLLASLNHPRLVALYDADLAAEQPYVVMELVEGASLSDDLARRGRLEPARTARLGAEIADGLAYVHARDVVHRDVKPGNVLLTPDDHAKVADFGIARLVDDARITQTGLMVGTAAYLAPEQVRGQSVTTAADVYSLGLVLLECLTGRREYEGTATAAAGARLHRPPEVPASFGRGWGSLLTAMTADAPAARPSAAAVTERLRAIAGGDTSATRVLAPPPPTQVLPTAEPVVAPVRRGSAGWWVAGALVALLLVGGIVAAVVLANRDNSPTTPTVPTTTATTPSMTTSSSAPPTTSTSSSSSLPPETTSSEATTSSSAPPTTSSTPATTSTSAAATTSMPAPPVSVSLSPAAGKKTKPVKSHPPQAAKP